MTPLTIGSFFSGIGAFDLGFERAGFTPVFASEVKPYALAVYHTHWPDTPNLGDLNLICPDGVGPNHTCEIPAATVWTGGFPCSDLSVMGHRKGLQDGGRSSLALVFLDLVDRHRPEFIVLENVPGLLISREGRDFATLLGTLVELGYGWGYRVLDARDFGLPQSRRRVFIVAGPTARAAGAVLDDATPRRLAVEPLGGAGRALVAGGYRRPDPDRLDIRTVVIGPTISRGGNSSIISRANDTHALTPRNVQYVITDLDDGTEYDAVLRRGPARTAEGVDAAGEGPGQHDLRDDDGRPERLPADAGSEADAPGVRTASGVPDRLDDPESGDGETLWPQRLDASRWHVLGRTLPVPIASWLADGLRTVIERRDADPAAYAD